MSTLEAVEVPQSLAVSYARGFGEEGRAWIAGLPTLAAEFLDRWELKRDGAVGVGEASLVLPVLRRNGTRAVLKLQMPREETTAALIGLRTWNGDGMVRLLDHDPETSTMLLERLKRCPHADLGRGRRHCDGHPRRASGPAGQCPCAPGTAQPRRHHR